MIPIRLSLQHFLSYRAAVLDLSGLHTACICGANGSGKSALLEAITWALWGQSRAVTDEDLIYKGETETQVELVYRSHDQVYRILRGRTLGGSSLLEWQIQVDSRWRTLTRKGIRATQQAIQSQLRLDYDTFVNSAYLRQGRADEFTLKRPNERKQILAEILKLGQYEELAEKCREQSRIAKSMADHQQAQLERLSAQQAEIETILTEKEWLIARQAQLEAEQARDQLQLQHLQDQAQQRIALGRRYQEVTAQLQSLTVTLQGTEQQWRQQRQQLAELEALLNNGSEIQSGYQRHHNLSQQDQHLNNQFQQHQILLEQRQQVQQQITTLTQTQHRRIQQLQGQLGQLQAQQQADEKILQEGERIRVAYQKLTEARQHLKECDHRQTQATPLQIKQQHLLQQLRRAEDKLLARRTLLHQQLLRFHEQEEQFCQVKQAILEVEVDLCKLEEQRTYQQQLLHKQQERQRFVNELQERQRAYQRQWQHLNEKLHLLPGSQQDHQQLHLDPSLIEGSEQPCPLCEQPLNPELRHRILEKHVEEQEDLQNQILVIREQLGVADREIQVMGDEYQKITQELKRFDHQLHTQGRLRQQLEASESQLSQLYDWQTEIEALEETLHQESYSQGIRAELKEVQTLLEQISYSDKDQALWRAEADRWRWADSKYAEWQKASQQKTQKLIQRILTEISNAENPEALHPLTEQLQAIDDQLKGLSYDVATHQRIRVELTQTQTYLAQAEALRQAKHQHPIGQAQCSSLVEMLQQQRLLFAQSSRELDQLHQQLATLPADAEAQTKGLAGLIADRRPQLDRILSQLGAVHQRLEQVQHLEHQKTELTQQLQQSRRQMSIHQELANAYGRNGIPALIIENVLPELEAEANQILAKLTANQLHLQFITQRSGRRSTKLIDTLDIVIADPRGTRAYETYSGGEAFRINFAIRLALSRLLAHRAGARLQTLWIDEGFGSQDEVGRQQLLSAISTVAHEFACILVITHIPSLRDAFPQRIEVNRTQQGSEVRIRL